jgi:ParB-like chromosome segregation protein Spo0J
MTAPANSWRDRVRVHPAADLFPLMSDDELDELAEDIRKHGRQQQLVFWTPERLGRYGPDGPKDVYLLDGRNRLAAIERAFAGDIPRQAGEIEGALYLSPGGGARLLHADDDPWAFVISANIHRRHLNRQQKRELIAQLLKLNPKRSDRATGKLAKTDHKTVSGLRVDLEGRGEIPHAETRIDATGRQQPAAKPPKAPSKEAQLRALREQQAVRQADDATAPQRPAPDRFGAVDELVQVLSVLRGNRTRIEDFPLAKRVALARGCLIALDVTLEDLRPVGGAP